MKRFVGKTLLMMAGGTGGHVYPALAVARAAHEEGARIHWLGNTAGFEGGKVAAAGFELHDIAVRGLRGKGVIGWGKAPWMITRAVLAARKVITQVRPDVAIGMGGFASGPGGIAAKLCAVKLLVHEQNAVMGLTNRCLARLADRVLLADPRAAAKLSSGRAYRVVGNPLRADIAAMAAPAVRYAARQGKISLLVLGGSQGAKTINELVPKALAQVAAAIRPAVRHQVGTRWFEITRQRYQCLGVEAEVVPFIEDMAAAYHEADWVIARAGALTVAEIATAGLPALFIPFPHAVDDHQKMNAQALAETGAAEVIEQERLCVDRLATAIAARRDRPALLRQAEKARRFSHAGALEKILSVIAELCQ